ncbi:MAG: transposase [Planctomycetes bacterium]|nr:transposase [Planctomycetota bacterium]
MEFVAIDVETANADMASICQVGIAQFRDNVLVAEWSTLIDPEDYFDPFNTAIHGITEKDVVQAPTFPQIRNDLMGFLASRIAVSHTHFDRVSIRKAVEKYSLDPIETTWLDSARVARRTWPECSHRGYGLSNVCGLIGYDFQHHDALEDAKACGQVLIAAIRTTGLDLVSWLKRVNQPIDPARSGVASTITREGNPEGDLYGEVLVFTGALTLPRRQAADLAAIAGCSVASAVTKKTTLLVVGDQDVTKLAGKAKSSKHIMAEKLIAEGQQIRVLKESDFLELVEEGDGYA